MTNLAAAIENSLAYLASEEAQRSLAADPYWPKWHSPWWHMLVLHELGETKRIPAATVRNLVAALDRYPLKIFPIHPGELPVGVDPHRGYPCHCQLGNVYQVLAAWGVAVDDELPWIRPWLLRYQMADGGLNCDNAAYLVVDECPSSMVGTIAAFEAILLYTNRPWTNAELAFLDRAARFLQERKLLNGSPTQHNAEERDEAKAWIRPCFPRLYHYDLLRGLRALSLWAELRGQTLEPEATKEALAILRAQFPDGQIIVERQAFVGAGTLAVNARGEWQREPQATLFPLLTEVSEVGRVSPVLTAEWREIQAKLKV